MLTKDIERLFIQCYHVFKNTANALIIYMRPIVLLSILLSLAALQMTYAQKTSIDQTCLIDEMYNRGYSYNDSLVPKQTNAPFFTSSLTFRQSNRIKLTPSKQTQQVTDQERSKALTLCTGLHDQIKVCLIDSMTRNGYDPVSQPTTGIILTDNLAFIPKKVETVDVIGRRESEQKVQGVAAPAPGVDQPSQADTFIKDQ